MAGPYAGTVNDRIMQSLGTQGYTGCSDERQRNAFVALCVYLHIPVDSGAPLSVVVNALSTALSFPETTFNEQYRKIMRSLGATVQPSYNDTLLDFYTTF